MSVESEDLQTLHRKRGHLKGTLTRFVSFVDNIKGLEPDENKIAELELRMSRLDTLLDDFDALQLKIDSLGETSDLINETANFEEIYFQNMSIAKTIVSNFNKKEIDDVSTDRVSEHSSGNSSRGFLTAGGAQGGVKLPTIDLPKFDGDYEKWLEYRDVFKSLIHENDAIGKIQKFFYMRASLTGNAAQVIKSIEFTERNYEIAWNLICDRYNNEKLIIHNHVKSLFNLPQLKCESSSDLRKLIDTFSKHLRALNSFDLPTDQWDILVIYVVTSKLDVGTVKEWESYQSNIDMVKLEDLKVFLKHRADLLESLELHSSKQTKKDLSTKKASFVSNSHSNNNSYLCPICKESHTIYACSDFKQLSPETRLSKIKNLKLCIKCLRGNHFIKNCQSGTCRKCGGMHHTLLHFDKSSSRENDTVADTVSATSTCAFGTCTKSVLLSTAVINVFDRDGNIHTCRVLLDSGSMSNFISEDFMNKLGISKSQVNMSVTGIGQVESNIKHSCVAEIGSRINSFKTKLKFFAIPNITDSLPGSLIDISSLNIPQHLKLADPDFSKPAEIDMLLGAGIFWQLTSVGQIRLGNNGPVAQKTLFGWIISGQLTTHRSSRVHCNFVKQIDIQQQLQKFWELEELHSEPIRSNEESEAELHFVNTFSRDSSGRFVVEIPLKDSPSKLGDSKHLAIKRFYNLERKLNSNPKLKQMYSDFMLEYEKLGHMSKYDSNPEVCYYFPHHGVLNENSSTTRLRVVFDGSAPSSSGVSYNSIQMVGPTIQDELFSILLRFRKYPFVVSADITKMYRQVLVSKEYRNLQLIVWRPNPASELFTYCLNTVTYGTASGSFLAIRTLIQLANEYQSKFPLASDIIKRAFYVDDLLFGGDTVEEVVSRCREISSILESGKFKLRKWSSNSMLILQGIEQTLNPETVLHFGQDQATKTLGLFWSCREDILSFKCDQFSGRVSKRTILSTVAQIFDPLGIVSPCIIVAKILLQKLWLLKLSWDETVPVNVHTQWQQFQSGLSDLNTLTVPRHIICKSYKRIEMHGFSDASKDAYGCCIYIRSIDQSNHIHCHLLCSKSKVAPLKVISIPKLELCGALLLAKLYHKVKQSIDILFDGYFLWSDSTVVLSWLRTSPNLLQVFVANRVSEIQTITSDVKWHHVSSKDNPADMSTRGVLPSVLKESPLWWHGPEWLTKDSNSWDFEAPLLSHEEIPELRKSVVSCVQVEILSPFEFDRFSSLNRIKRVAAYVLRFIRNCRKSKEARNYNSLTSTELSSAFIQLIKFSQQSNFAMEIQTLSSGKSIKSTSKILSLTPFLDEDLLLRVGGRLKQSSLPFNKKHPILLPGKHRLTYLIFRHYHYKLMHIGAQSLLASIRDNFWPIAGRNMAKKIVLECVVCSRYNPKPSSYIMGDLPDSRITPKPPFDHTGVDYAGPFVIKDRKGRGCKKMKCYLCSFICLVTKAVHLEVVTNLSTASFLNTFRRFTSRRGKPSHMFSDNGTNFVGAHNELQELGSFLRNQHQDVHESCSLEGITWHFIPAYSPHMGGLWEAGVKSSKFHLKRVIGNLLLTYEDFYTVIVQIEGILNSRPLTPLSTDPNDHDALTPAHFLIGRRITAVPESDIRSLPVGRIPHYRHLQHIHQQFWSRWNVEYLSQLQHRVKWKEHGKEIKVNSLVIIKDDHLPPAAWLLGRVVKLYPGPDGVTRVVTIKTVKGDIKRPVTKICALPESD